MDTKPEDITFDSLGPEDKPFAALVFSDGDSYGGQPDIFHYFKRNRETDEMENVFFVDLRVINAVRRLGVKTW